MRSMVVLGVFILQGLLAVVLADSANAEPISNCDSQAPGGERLDIECRLTASGSAQRFAFTTNFSGGHDDTTASLIATLDGMPLACEEGSKTSLVGEDGDVSLECKFTVRAEAGTRTVLRVALSWRHAEYVDFAFHAD